MSTENEVLMWHVALDADKKLQPIMALRVPFGDIEVLKMLLQTDRPGGRSVDYDEKIGYLFAYDNDLVRPYPSVMIFRFDRTEHGNIVRDMERDDFRAVRYAVENLL